MHKQVELLLKLQEIEQKRMNKEERRVRIQRLVRRIDPDLLLYYNLRKKASGYCLAPIQDLVCQGCGMKYPEANLIIQKMGTEVTRCEFCGRIVYPAPPKKRQKKKTSKSKPATEKKKSIEKKSEKKKVVKKTTKKKVTKKKTVKKKPVKKKVTKKKVVKKKVTRKKVAKRGGKKKTGKKTSKRY